MTKGPGITISLDASQPSHAVSPHLYGVFFEEINYAGVGGIYAEKIQNRAFMDPRTPPVWPRPEITRQAGRFGNAIELNGDTGNAKIKLPEGIVAGLTTLTIAAWVNPTKSEGFAKVFDFGNIQTGILYYNTSGAHMSLALASSPYMGGGPGPSFVILLDGKKETLNAPEPLPTNEWTHLAVTLDGATAKIFVNGAAVAESNDMTLSPALMGPTRDNWIGASQFAFDPLLHGYVDDFHIFDFALDESGVQSLMESSGGSVGGGNVAWYRFDEEAGPTLTDSSGVGRHAAVVAHDSAWEPVIDAGGSMTVALDESEPLNETLTRSLRLDIENVAAGQRVGMANGGYFGTPAIAGEAYRVSFWAKAATGLASPITVGIEKADGSRMLASAQVSGLTSDWQRFEASLVIPADAGSSDDNRFVIGVDRRGESVDAGAAPTSDATVWLQVVSLFAPTYKNRANGLRPDLVEMLKALKPKFLRFPGGTYVLGHTVETRFNWKESIGPIWERPGHDNDVWRYWSDDGLGLLEYLQLAEDLDATPAIGVYPGLSGGRPVPEDELAPYVQDALDLIEYTTGPVTSRWGARRAADGHPKPFPTPIIEIGNEDFLGIGDSYATYRYPMFYNAIKAAYPDVKTIATMAVPDHPVEIRDEHMYRSPQTLIERGKEYDNYDRNGPQIFVGEWSVITTAGNNPTADLEAAIAEAAFMTVLERNSDIVAMQCYAPLFAFDGHTQWNPDLIGFGHLGSYGSPSYWAQHLFATRVGNQYLPVDVSSDALHCAATLETTTGTVFLKIVNTTEKSQPVTVVLAGSNTDTARVDVLTGHDPRALNDLAEPRRVVPTSSTLQGESGTFAYEAPARSATVFTM